MMKNRIFKNWKTTLTGILMLAGGLALVGIGKATLSEYVVFAPVCFALLFVKDPSFKENHGKARIVCPEDPSL